MSNMAKGNAILDEVEKKFSELKNEKIILKLKDSHDGTVSYVLSHMDYGNFYFRHLMEAGRHTFGNNRSQLVERVYDYTIVSDQEYKLLKSCFANKKPRTIKKHVGVEMELISNVTANELGVLFAQNKLNRNVTVKFDGSVNPSSSERNKGYKYPVELAIMDTEENINKTILKVCKLLENLTIANESCGLHVHIDSRQRDRAILYKNLFEAQALLYSLCDYPRETNTYCKIVRDYYSFGPNANSGDRYSGINKQAFGKFKTLEVRIMNGTNSGEFLSKYIELLLKIADTKCLDHNRATIKTNFTTIKKHFKLRGNLEKFVLERIKKYNTKNTTLVNL